MSKLMFSKRDVDAAGHPLVRLLRLIFYRRGVTLERFNALYSEHGARMRETPNVTSMNRANTRKALEADKSLNNSQMTWRLFYYVLTSILRLNIREVRVVLHDPVSGQVVVIGSHDPVDGHAERVQEPPE